MHMLACSPVRRYTGAQVCATRYLVSMYHEYITSILLQIAGSLNRVLSRTTLTVPV